MAEHTPIPWPSNDELPRGYPPKGTYMRREDGGWVRLSPEDYALAGRCVNSHDALVKKLEQVVLWLERGAANAFKLAENCQFPKLAAAWTADGKNYRAMAADIRKTLALAEQEKTGD